MTPTPFREKSNILKMPLKLYMFWHYVDYGTHVTRKGPVGLLGTKAFL